MSRVDFFLSTRKTKVGLLIELSTMVPLDHAVLNGKVVGSHQAYGIPVPGGARAGGRGAPVGEPSGDGSKFYLSAMCVRWAAGRAAADRALVGSGSDGGGIRTPGGRLFLAVKGQFTLVGFLLVQHLNLNCAKRWVAVFWSMQLFRCLHACAPGLFM